MGGTRSLWSAGQALVVDDLTSFATNASTESDRVLEMLVASPNTQKHIIPLVDESTSAGTTPGLLVYAGSPWTVGSAVFVAGQSSAANVAMASPYFFSSGSGVFGPFTAPSPGSNSSGSNRYDLLYATLARNVTSTSSRKVKDPTSGAISTQTLNLLDVPAVSLSIVTSTVSIADALSKLPADSGTAYNFALAVATIANGYTSGSALTQSQITQTWPGGFLRPRAVRGARAMSIFTSGANESPTTGGTGKVQNDRWGSQGHWIGAFKLLTTTNTSTGIVLDNTVDWRNRFLYGFIARPAVSGGLYPPAESVTVPGATNAIAIGPAFTGSAGGTAASWSSAGSGACTFALSANSSTGALTLIPSAANPSDAINGDNYVLMLMTTDRFSF